ncbi:leucine-rich repeat-containing protein 27-like [Brachyistius frenatus]|uniref:leucine-rich repeat-containing protein 27-like n=1 Tax=Brachyistius frenatus TaxID=100188 RepID=UPI0037E79564
MTSPEKKEKHPDVQLSFVFGNSVVKAQTPRSPSEEAEPQEPAEYYSTETLYLSRSELKHFPDSILKNSRLKNLSLEGNQISTIPGTMFISLPNLLWLDLRRNLLVSLPAEIGSHRSLRTLLLEGNPISELPPELGNVITLKGLNLRDCPILFPPQDTVHQGLRPILHYLRNAMAEQPVSARKTPEGVTVVSLPEELPVVEKLQLLELMGSGAEEQEESVDEMQRFTELKQKLILLDKAELSSTGEGDKKPKSQLIPINKRKIITARIIPELPLFDTQHMKSPEERRQAAMKEQKEKQAILEQRRKNQEALQKWRTQAKITQEKKMSEQKHKKQERQKKREEGAQVEPGLNMRQQQIPEPVIEHAASAKEERDSSGATQSQTSGTSVTGREDDRSARELEQQIRARVEDMQERHRNPRGTATEQMAAADEDVEEMRKLQMQLKDRKKNRGRDVEKIFNIFTGYTLPSFLDK